MSKRDLIRKAAEKQRKEEGKSTLIKNTTNNKSTTSSKTTTNKKTNTSSKNTTNNKSTSANSGGAKSTAESTLAKAKLEWAQNNLQIREDSMSFEQYVATNYPSLLGKRKSTDIIKEEGGDWYTPPIDKRKQALSLGKGPIKLTADYGKNNPVASEINEINTMIADTEDDSYKYEPSFWEKFGEGAAYTLGKVGYGVIDGVESGVDFLAGMIPAIGWGVTGGFGLWENDLSREFEREFDVIHEDDITDYLPNLEETWTNAPDWLKEYGWLPEGVGNMIPTIATTALTGGGSAASSLGGAASSLSQSTTLGSKIASGITNNPGQAVFFANASGSATEDAVKKGANPLTATVYGGSVGAAEVATENLFHGMADKTFAKPFVNFSTRSQVVNKALSTLVGEPLEEMIMTGADPVLQRATGVDPNAEFATAEEYIESGKHGAILSAVMNVAGVPASVKADVDKTKLIRDINKTSEAVNTLEIEGIPQLDPLPILASDTAIEERQAELIVAMEVYDEAVKRTAEMEKAMEGVPTKEVDTEVVDTEDVDNPTAVEWNAPGKETPIAYSSVLTKEWVQDMANDEDYSSMNVREFKDAVGFDDETSNVLQRYIDEGYGGTNVRELFSDDRATYTREATVPEYGTKADTREATIPEVEPTREATAPETVSTKKKGISISERLELQSRNNEAIAVEDVKKATGFGDEGSKLVTELANRDGVTFDKAKNAVQNAYLAGFTNLERAKVNFVTDTQINAFTAGKKDWAVQHLKAKAEAKKASVYKGVFTENEYTKSFTDAEKKMISTVAKHFGMDVSVVDKIIANEATGTEANASHTDGKMEISSTAENVIYKLVLHEGGHRMKQLAPAEFDVLMTALFDRAVRRNAKLGVPQTAMFDDIKSEHDRAGISLDTSDYLEEFVARELESIFGSAEEFNAWRAELDGNVQAKSAWQKFMDFLLEIFDKVKTAIYDPKTKMSEQEMAEAKIAHAKLENIKKLYEKAYKATRDAVQERAKEVKAETKADTKTTTFSLKDKKTDTKSTKNLEIKINEEYNGRKDHSLKSEQYTDSEYRDFGWARENEILNAKQNEEYRSKFADATVGGTKFPKSKWGEYIIPVSDSTFDGVNNTLVFAKGTIDNPIITSVIEIFVFDETNLDRIRRRIYECERRGIQQKTGELFIRHNAFDFKFRPNKPRVSSESIGNSSDNGYGKRSSGETSSTEKGTKVSYSLKESNYLELAKNPEQNKAELDKMVYEEAKKAGFSTKVFHGTTGFGFTKLDVSKSDDSISFFATDSLDLAQTYSGVLGETSIKKGNKGSVDNQQRYDNLVDNFVNKINEIAGREILTKDNLPFDRYLNKVKKGKMDLNKLSKAMTDYTMELIEGIEEDTRVTPENDRLIWELSAELELALYGLNGKSGNYGLYANTDNFLVVEGNGANWSSIPFDKIPSKTATNTREITAWAKENGYDGVLFKDIYDLGLHRSTKTQPANVYAFLKPETQLKSADPVTYDALGRVIPLSKRFNNQKKDIRYSLKDSDGKTLTNEQAEYFKDSKVRDSKGNLLVVYHGSPAKFTVFDHYHINKRGNSHGRGFYFTEKKSLAEGYEKEGGQLLKGYLNITKPLSEDKKTMKKADLLKLIKATCEAEARMIVEDGGYDNVREALRDTWISNCVNTYEMSMDSAYREVLNIYWNGNDNDVELISDLTNSGAGNENTLRQVHDVLGYDGVIYTAPDGTHEFVSLVSEQFKSVDNDKPSSNPDINFSLKGGISHTEFLDTVEDLQKGESTAASKLAKYAESGAISTKVYNDLIKKYGAIETGENPHREVSVPKKTAKDKKVSMTVRTVLEAESTPDTLVPTIEKMVEDGVFSYDVYTDKEAINNAENYIKEYGWEESLLDWFDAVNKGEVSKDLTTTGWALYNNAANKAATATTEDARKEATKTSIRILDAMIHHQRSAAQALQATRILKKMSPETQLYAVQKSVSALQNELKEKYGKKAPDLKINEELAEQFLTAETEEARLDAEIKIYKDIGKQMPSTFMDRWNAWRYLAMLGNLRTHGRNVLGNAFFAPVVATKNLVATGIESIVAPVVRLSGKEMLRGKKFVFGSKADRALLKAAWNDYANVADAVSNGGKYNDSAMANKHIDEGRKIFKSKLFAPVEWARKKTSKALETEDVWFSKPHYAYALAMYCKANNITPEQIQRGKAIAPAREYAIKEAQKATYKDTNAFSQFVSSLGRTHTKKNAVTKTASAVVEGILPFRKTPANILVRGVEYSPLGLVKGLTRDLYKVSKGEMNAYEAIDNISAGLTGTGLLALGVYLAAEGLIRGHGEDEEKEKGFKEMMGHQAYSLELPNGQSITLDWLAPEALPFFVGVNIWETTKGKNEKVNMASILNAVTGITEPMLEMSCLQGVNDLIEGVGYASSNGMSGLMAVLSSATTSYLTQGIPTLSGQAERTSEDERMTTYTDKNDFLTGDMQYLLGKASAKIPGWDYNQIPYIDAWGRREASGTALKRGLNNFLNPAYTSTIESSEMEKELLRVYEQTGEASVFPTRADKSFTVDGVDKYLTADEYVRYATLKGEKSYKLVTELVESEAYKKLSDKEKVKAIEEVYDYANQKAKEAISNYNPDKWVGKADDFENPENYLAFRSAINDDMSKQDVVDVILDMAENDSEAWDMYLSKYDSKAAIEARNDGVDADAFMAYSAGVSKADEDGSLKKEEVVDVIAGMNIDNDDAWTLYFTNSNYDTEKARNAEKHGIDAKLFMTATVDMGSIKADKDSDGKSISGSRRAKIERYLNSVCDSYKEYLFLLGTEYDSVKKDPDYISYFGN